MNQALKKGKVTHKPLGRSDWERVLAELGQCEGKSAVNRYIANKLRQHAELERRSLGALVAGEGPATLETYRDLDVGFVYAIADLIDPDINTLGRAQYVLPYSHHDRVSRNEQITSGMRERVKRDPQKHGAIKRAAIAELAANPNAKLTVATAIRYYRRDYPAKDATLPTQASQRQQRQLTDQEWRAYNEQLRDERARAARSAARGRQRQRAKTKKD